MFVAYSCLIMGNTTAIYPYYAIQPDDIVSFAKIWGSNRIFGEGVTIALGATKDVVSLVAKSPIYFKFVLVVVSATS